MVSFFHLWITFSNLVDVGVVRTQGDTVVLCVVESVNLLTTVTSNIRIKITIYKLLFRKTWNEFCIIDMILSSIQILNSCQRGMSPARPTILLILELFEYLTLLYPVDHWAVPKVVDKGVISNIHAKLSNFIGVLSPSFQMLVVSGVTNSNVILCLLAFI